jgi:hypothetical protein
MQPHPCFCNGFIFYFEGLLIFQENQQTLIAAEKIKETVLIPTLNY